VKGFDTLEALVRIPSPTGQEEEAVRFMQRQAANDGFRVLEDEAGNFIAETGTGKRLLLFVGHIDTVPGDIPVRREGGVLHGRGTVDAKGPLVAFYEAARGHLDTPDLTIRIVGAVDEEGHSRGAKAVPETLDPSWILIGEPSGSDGLTLGYKGILRGTYRLTRERAHGAHRGRSAVEEAIEFWRILETRYRFGEHFETVQGRLDRVQTTTDGLNDTVECGFNLRLPPGIDAVVMKAEIDRAAEAAGIDLDIDELMAGALASKRTPLVAAFLSSMREQGLTPNLKRKTGTADFNLFAQRHPEVPLAAYGPGDASLDHTPHEHVSAEEFARAVEVLDRVLGALAAMRATGPVRRAPPQQL
jgi:[amino group carrier protein]-lysine/ornithine hydrolase